METAPGAEPACGICTAAAKPPQTHSCACMPGRAARLLPALVRTHAGAKENAHESRTVHEIGFEIFVEDPKSAEGTGPHLFRQKWTKVTVDNHPIKK